MCCLLYYTHIILWKCIYTSIFYSVSRRFRHSLGNHAHQFVRKWHNRNQVRNAYVLVKFCPILFFENFPLNLHVSKIPLVVFEVDTISRCSLGLWWILLLSCIVGGQRLHRHNGHLIAGFFCLLICIDHIGDW